ncbi:unnamed protein product [Gadus morhua 'NCC']
MISSAVSTSAERRHSDSFGSAPPDRTVHNLLFFCLFLFPSRSIPHHHFSPFRGRHHHSFPNSSSLSFQTVSGCLADMNGHSILPSKGAIPLDIRGISHSHRQTDRWKEKRQKTA